MLAMLATKENVMTRTGMMFNGQNELIRQNVTVIHGGATLLVGTKLYKRHDIIMTIGKISAIDGSWHLYL